MSSDVQTTSTDEVNKYIAPWWQTALVLLPLCIGSAVSAHQHTLEHVNLPGMSARLSGYFTVMAEEWLSVLFLWLALRRREFSISRLISGRWQNPVALLRDLGLAIGFFLAVLPILAVMGRILGTDPNQISFVPKTAFEAIIWLAVATTAGFCEELIFRGYLTQQLTGWTNSRVLALVIQGVAFGLAHGYQARSMVAIMIYGWLVGLLAFWRKSLRPGMFSHALQDGVVGLLAFFFMK
jgi:membrane protease YdiL (CAAX protease family)